MQALLGSAGTAVSPIFLGANSAEERTSVTLWKKDITFGNEAGNNRLLVIVYMSEANNARIHSAPKYDGKDGVIIGQRNLDNAPGPDGQALAISASYWLEANLPSTSGAKEFEVTLDGLNIGHMARAFLFKNVDQTTPIGTFRSTSAVDQVPTYTTSLGLSLTVNDAVIVAVGMAARGPTYVSGDLKDNGSNMNNIVEQQARDPATPGGALASAWDVVPAINENYVWDCKYGTSTSVDSTVMLFVPIKVKA